MHHCRVILSDNASERTQEQLAMRRSFKTNYYFSVRGEEVCSTNQIFLATLIVAVYITAVCSSQRGLQMHQRSSERNSPG